MSEPKMLAIEQRDLCDGHGSVEWVPAPCQKACPVGTDVPSYISLIWEGKLKEALEAITDTNPFSSVCGRVCSMPCEISCRRAESDGSVAIRNLKRFVMDQLGHDYRLPPVAVSRKQTIGIVGGGPTGLTAAQDLAKLGYQAHVYERSDRLGGMMRAIPEFRLPQSAIDEDIGRLLAQCPGIVAYLGSALGSEISLDELKVKHDAVLLAIGLWRDRRLRIPGEDESLDGLYGVDLVAETGRGVTRELSGRAVVIGGGNVAMDMARTALRLGAREVHLYCLESRSEMPAWRHEIDDAQREGIRINPSWGPKQILNRNGRVTGVEFVRCVSVFDDGGRFNPSYDPDKTTQVDADSVLVAIGLQAASDELEAAGMIDRGLVKAEFGTMRTADPKVFAAGDCAFGPSAIVDAMNHGHRAAYYINAFLEGQEGPLPYATPYRTRRVPVAQDPMWEKLSREEQAFHGFDPTRPFASESETAYDLEAARRQAARCLRCDAETGSANYPRGTRELIRAMSETDPEDAGRLRTITRAHLRPRENPFPPDRPPHIDDLVFLSAALTRLVIDPYREACNTTTAIGASVKLQQPCLFCGFDDAPDDVRHALAQGIEASGCGYVGVRPLPSDAAGGNGGSPGGKLPWLQLLVPGQSEPRSEADGLVYVVGADFDPPRAERLRGEQLLGLSVRASALEESIPYALENEFDVLLLDGTSGIGTPWVELHGYPDLTVLRHAIRILRDLDREEEISLLYFGGVKSGTDLAKVLAINCVGAVFGVAMALAVGGAIGKDGIDFQAGPGPDERASAVENWIQATAEETAIIARCTGKTNVHNLEPEDMRSITLATSEAIGIPMASGMEKREWF
ncbi:MAG: FAD-dependent oxidoreductase [Candidatus Latescibacteria bacterium]|nr:FAD-dependent oxidoreductase [Candidatus Latescibacterota bacterium]